MVCYVLFWGFFFFRSLDASQLVGGGTISLPLGLVNVLFFSHRLFSSLSTLMSSRSAGRQLQKHMCDSLEVGGVSGAARDASPLEREDKAAMWTPFSVDASWLLQRLVTGLRLSLCVAATSERVFFFFLSLCCLFVSAIAFVQEEKSLFFVEKWSHSCTITVPSVISAKWKILQTNKKMGSFSFFFFF